MSSYQYKLRKLQKEIKEIGIRKKKKRFKPNQKIMIDFINGVTKFAQFKIRESKILLYKGDDKKGFKHILQRHYNTNKGNLSTMDILNISDIIERGIRLSNRGVSNLCIVSNGDKAIIVFNHLGLTKRSIL